MTVKRIGYEIYAMKENKLLSLIVSIVVGLGSSAWAGPHGGGAFAGGGGHFGVNQFGSYYSGGPHAAPAYEDQPAYVDSDQYGKNATVRKVQSELAKLRYYRGAIDGIIGDETQAALARYQEDRDLSVTGTLTAATLQSLGLAWTTS
jgi:hypothetical protein